jgi:hypothetical protein
MVCVPETPEGLPGSLARVVGEARELWEACWSRVTVIL